MIEYTVEDLNRPTQDALVNRYREWMKEKELGPRVDAILRNPSTKEVRAVKVGRNELCPCGSGLKFKKCCLWKVDCGVEIVSGD